MDNNKPVAQRRCKAMVDADISDPNSQDGIDFCVNNCPYSYCIVVEYSAVHLKRTERAIFAKKLREHKVSVDDIALILGVTARSVMGYLRR